MFSVGGRPTIRRPRPASLVVAACLGFLAAYRFAQPVAADQALAILMGERLRGGAVIYRDVWDIRQPILYFWFAVVGGTLGKGALAVRVAELLWQGVLAWLIARDAATRGGNRRQAICTALACVAPLFIITRANDVAQPETLLLLPLYLALRAVALPGRLPLRMRTAASLGVLTVVIAMFKLLFAPLPVVFVAIWCAHNRPTRGEALRAAAWYSAAFVGAASIVVVYFAHHGIWGWVAHTWFIQGPAMRGLSPPPLSRLVRSVGRVAVLAAPLVIGAAVSLVRLRRRPRDVWELSAAAWLLTAFVIVLAQQWWPYQMLGLLTPLGLLAAGPLSAVVHDQRRVVVAAVVVACLAIASDVDYAQALLRHGPDAPAIARDLDPAVRDRDDATSFLSDPGRLTGDVYVFASPVMLLDLPREQRISIHGWSPEFYDDTTWTRLAAQLAANPPAYVFIDGFSEATIRRRAPDLWQWLDTRYAADGHLPQGISVFRRNDD